MYEVNGTKVDWGESHSGGGGRLGMSFSAFRIGAKIIKSY